MTLMAGVLGTRPDSDVDTDWARHLVSSLTRDPGDVPLAFRRPGAVLVKVDVGAFGSAAHHEVPGGAVTLICGEPLIEGHGLPGRANDLRVLHEHGVQGTRRGEPGFTDFLLLRARGTFSAAHLSPTGRQLHLATDPLGVRPLYWTHDGRRFAFSSRFQTLATLPGLSPELDLDGALEFASLGYSIGERTPREAIRRLLPGERLIVPYPGGTPIRHRYWKWPNTGTETRIPAEAHARTGGDPTDPASALEQTFRTAVALRLGKDRSTVAYLSGGLDSRVIVGVLRDLGREVFTFNFSAPGQQDDLFGRALAERLGTHHVSRPRTRWGVAWDAIWSVLLREEWDRRVHREDVAVVERPSLVWSGDGGSVAVGGVYLEDWVVLPLERDGFQPDALLEVADRYTIDLPLGILNPRSRSGIEYRVHRNIVGELQALRTEGMEDPIEAFHVYLLRNDQRRHLDGHFEQIDRHRLEFQLPFFDARVLEVLRQVPARALQGHAFYHRWLQYFSSALREVPWQTYPGHLPCPVQTEPDATTPADQWSGRRSDSARALRREARRTRRRMIMHMLRSRDFPEDLLSKARLAAAGALDQLGIRDYSHAIHFAWNLHRFAAPSRLRDSG